MSHRKILHLNAHLSILAPLSSNNFAISNLLLCIAISKAVRSLLGKKTMVNHQRFIQEEHNISIYSLRTKLLLETNLIIKKNLSIMHYCCEPIYCVNSWHRHPIALLKGQTNGIAMVFADLK